MKINTLQQNDANYPSSLRNIHDPPERLYVRGQLNDAHRVAVVGSRKPSSYGLRSTQSIVQALSRQGVQIVSGLAYGIDSEAHKACLAVGGSTLAVMAGGLDAIYPMRNSQLAEEILAQKGALISEYAAGEPAHKHHFIARNRIIAGISQAVIVVEAAAKSGSLWTADFALQAGTPVLAVPGPIDSPLSYGTNALIDQGARIITRVADIFDEIGFKPDHVTPKNNDDPLLQALSATPQTAETLANLLQLSYRDTLQRLSLLEIQGYVINGGDGRYHNRSQLGV